MKDHMFGTCLLVGTGIVFFYYTLWVIVLPFVDEDQHFIQAWFPDRKYALALPLLGGVIGLLAIGYFVTVVLLRRETAQKVD